MFDVSPEDWTERRLVDVACINPESLGQRADPTFSFGYIDISQIERPGVCAGWSLTEFAQAPSRARRVVREGDILVSTVRPYLRAFALVPPSGCALVASTGFAVVRAQDGVAQEFLFQHIMSEGFVEHLKPRMTGSNYPAVGADDVGDYSLQLPSLNEQLRITEVLRSVDDAFNIQFEVLNQLHKTKAAAIEHLMAESLKVGTTVPLSDITACMDSGWSPDCESMSAGTEEWAVLKTSAVTWEGYDDNQNKRLPANLQPRAHLAVQTGDILITRAGPAERTGVVAMVDATYGHRMISDKIIRVRIDLSRAVPLAVSEILASRFVQTQIGRTKSGMAASQTNITQKTVANLEIPLPPLEKQHLFASFVGSLNELIKLSRAQSDHLARLKSRLASELLSGRVRVSA
jgi:type I restriction enzyme S subunit